MLRRRLLRPHKYLERGDYGYPHSKIYIQSNAATTAVLGINGKADLRPASRILHAFEFCHAY